MATVHKRVVRSSPFRDTATTWREIVELLTRGQNGAARDELLSVAGVASSVIADRSPEDAAIVVTCEGPRTRIYCLYDEDASDDAKANEAALGYDALKGDWALSLPCLADDLDWVRSALKAKSARITARGPDETVAADDGTKAATGALEIDMKGLFGS